MKVAQWCCAVFLIFSAIGTGGTTLNLIGSVVAFVCGVLILPPVWNRLRLHKYLAVGVFALGAVAYFTTAKNNPPKTVAVASEVAVADKAPDWTLAQRVTADSTAKVQAEHQKIIDDIGLAPYKARRAIKRQLKDPDSFDEIDHKAGWVMKKGVYISCVVQYRAKNSFGGMAVERAQVDFNKAMEPIAVKSL